MLGSAHGVDDSDSARRYSIEAMIEDPDLNDTTVHVEVLRADTSAVVFAASGTATSPGERSTVTIPDGIIESGVTYRWRVRGDDGRATSPWADGDYQFTGEPKPEGTVSAAGTAGLGNRTRAYTPILLIHGWSRVSSNDCQSFNDLVNRLTKATKWRPAYKNVQRLSYYYKDGGACRHPISHHGKHENGYYGDVRAGIVEHRTSSTSSRHAGQVGHTSQANLRHLAYHLAWYIYDHNVRGRERPRHVSIVAHSMGAVVTRYAVAMVDKRTAGFPPTLFIDDVVLAGGPHAGATWANQCSEWNWQCAQLLPYNPAKPDTGWRFLTSLHKDGWNPQQGTGTDWTTLSSLHDGIASHGSASFMGAHRRFAYNSGISHSGLLKNADCGCYGYVSHNGAWPWTRASHPQPSGLIDRELWGK